MGKPPKLETVLAAYDGPRRPRGPRDAAAIAAEVEAVMDSFVRQSAPTPTPTPAPAASRLSPKPRPKRGR